MVRWADREKRVAENEDLQSKTNQGITCSIVIPAFNEEHRIGSTVESITKWKPFAPFQVELIISDDGSTDRTVDIVLPLLESWSHSVVLSLPHRGKAATVLEGFAHASGDVVGFMDSDLATPLEFVEPAVKTVLSTGGVVIGTREGAGASRHNEPQIRHLMGRVFNHLVQRMLLPGIEDTQCGFKFFSRAALDTILQYQRIYRSSPTVKRARVTAFDIELLYIACVHDFQITPLPVNWAYGSKSKVSPLADSFLNLTDVLRVRRNGQKGLYKGNATV